MRDPIRDPQPERPDEWFPVFEDDLGNRYVLPFTRRHHSAPTADAARELGRVMDAREAQMLGLAYRGQVVNSPGGKQQHLAIALIGGPVYELFGADAPDGLL